VTGKRIIQGLEREYSRLLGTRETITAALDKAQADAARHQSDVDEIDQTMEALVTSIRLFKPAWDPTQMEPRRTNVRRTPLPNGVASAFPKALLRGHPEGLSVAEIADEMMRVHNLPTALKSRLRQSIHHNMRSAERRGMAVKDEGSKKWRLIRKEPRRSAE